MRDSKRKINSAGWKNLKVSPERHLEMRKWLVNNGGGSLVQLAEDMWVLWKQARGGTAHGAGTSPEDSTGQNKRAEPYYTPETPRERKLVERILFICRRGGSATVDAIEQNLERFTLLETILNDVEEGTGLSPEVREYLKARVDGVVAIAKRYGLSAPPPHFLGVAAEDDDEENPGGDDEDKSS